QRAAASLALVQVARHAEVRPAGDDNAAQGSVADEGQERGVSEVEPYLLVLEALAVLPVAHRAGKAEHLGPALAVASFRQVGRQVGRAGRGLSPLRDDPIVRLDHLDLGVVLVTRPFESVTNSFDLVHEYLDLFRREDSAVLLEKSR